MRMKERIEGDVAVLELSGNLMGGGEVDQFQERLHGLKGDGFNKVVLDLGGVNLISSAGVGMLIAGAKTLREAGGDLKLANLTERVYNILVVITQLGSVFNIFETADRAAASFSMNK